MQKADTEVDLEPWLAKIQKQKLMKVLTILGTRPEIIRLSKVISKLDACCNHFLVHTGQSYDENMSEIFFTELNIRRPDDFMEIGGLSFGEQAGQLFIKTEQFINRYQPDRLLILGDTNSALSAIVAKRMGIRVCHMEAGNRCFDDIVPEEVNRRIIDHCSDIHMPYTERSRDNLLREGISANRIYVTGNPIREILATHQAETGILEEFGLSDDNYFLVSAHRQENVENNGRLHDILNSCVHMNCDYGIPVIFSCHPRTRKRIIACGYEFPEITFHEPFGLHDFLTLQRNAACVLTDSGTVQEECCILRVKCVTLRNTTERPETIECGSNVLAGVKLENIKVCVKVVMSQSTDWETPKEYQRLDVSDTVVRVVTGY